MTNPSLCPSLRSEVGRKGEKFCIFLNPLRVKWQKGSPLLWQGQRTNPFTQNEFYFPSIGCFKRLHASFKLEELYCLYISLHDNLSGRKEKKKKTKTKHLISGPSSPHSQSVLNVGLAPKFECAVI